MSRRFSQRGAVCAKALTGIATLALLSACTQLPRHSNALVFGTNTLFGVKAGTDAEKVPAVSIGYTRQELAIVPVFANTDMDDGRLSPCPGDIAITPPGGGGGPHTLVIDEIGDCKLLAEGPDDTRDAYSTLASFGGNGGTEVTEDGNVKGNVAVAQYFATGIAAQRLAETGGANVVTAGGDAKSRSDAVIQAANARAARADSARLKYAVGKGVALQRLGGDPDADFPATAASLPQFFKDMGAGCAQTNIDSSLTRAGYQDTQSGTKLKVGQFLDFMEKREPTCLSRLAK